MSFHCFYFQSYEVVDYFDLSREVVALSMSLFDRFFATKVCMPGSDLVLIASIATLHIAIKTRESAIIKLSTLSWLGRGRFSESRIARMELQILMSFKWLVNPPTAITFVMYLLLLLPDDLGLDLKEKILESSGFLAELSVADSFFITRRSSATGLAAIMISLDQCNINLSPTKRANYLNDVSNAIGIACEDDEIRVAETRLRLLSIGNGG